MLNDSDIANYIKLGKIITENYMEECLTPNGYDLRIGEHDRDTAVKNSIIFQSIQYHEITFSSRERIHECM